MDDRDVALIAQIEGGHVENLALIQLIDILSRRRLGPNTIDGVRIIDIRGDNPRVVAHHTRNASLERRAFELIKASRWYVQDRWPDPPREAEEVLGLAPGSLGFRQWVDHRLESLDVIDAIKHGREA